MILDSEEQFAESSATTFDISSVSASTSQAPESGDNFNTLSRTTKSSTTTSTSTSTSTPTSTTKTTNTNNHLNHHNNHHTHNLRRHDLTHHLNNNKDLNTSKAPSNVATNNIAVATNTTTPALPSAAADRNHNDETSGPSANLNLSAADLATFHGSRAGVHIGRKPAFGQTCSMKTLLQDGILQAGEKALVLECEGSEFCGDLRKDGTIMMRGPNNAPHIFATPVAWANHCSKIVNPECKPLNAWSSIRFRGKRLDSYKLKWYRAQKKPTPNTSINNSSIDSVGNTTGSMNLNDNINGGGSSIIRSLQQHLHHQQQQTQQQHSNNNTQHHLQQDNQTPQQSTSGRLMVHNQVSNHHFPQYENPLKNKKLIKSILISNTMDNDCRKLVAKSLDLSDDPSRIASINNNINTSNNDNNNNSTGIPQTLRPPVITYEQLGTRGPHNTHDPNTMVKCIPFSAVDRIQPFNVNVSTNALLLIDFHSHLVPGEVAGYLAGSWDLGTHVLTVTQAFPCRTTLDNEETAAQVEEEIRQDIEKRQMTVVGWYHSHQGKYSNHPTIRDIQNQMEYQITMKESFSGYTPCIGLICSPHDTRSDDDLSPSFQIYWVMPPPETLSNHYGRPMQMYYSVNRDLFLTQDLLLEMRLLANYFNQLPDMVNFLDIYPHNQEITYLDKLSGSIKPKLPKDLQESEYPDEPAIWKAAVDHFWKFLKNLVIPPPESAQDSKSVEDQFNEEDVTDKPVDEEPTEVDKPDEEQQEELEQEPKLSLNVQIDHEQAQQQEQEIKQEQEVAD